MYLEPSRTCTVERFCKQIYNFVKKLHRTCSAGLKCQIQICFVVHSLISLHLQQTPLFKTSSNYKWYVTEVCLSIWHTNCHRFEKKTLSQTGLKLMVSWRCPVSARNISPLYFLFVCLFVCFFHTFINFVNKEPFTKFHGVFNHFSLNDQKVPRKLHHPANKYILCWLWSICRLLEFFVNTISFHDRYYHFKEKPLLWSQFLFKQLDFKIELPFWNRRLIFKLKLILKTKLNFHL